MTLEPEDEAMLARLAIITELVHESEPQHERLDRLAAAGYVILVDIKPLRADIPRERAYRLTARGRAFLEDRKRKGELMRHHLITADVPCPFCGRPGLVFEHVIPMGDKYLCSGCKHASVHVSIGRREKECCLRTILSGANLGPLRPCGSQEGKVSPDE